MHQPPTKFEVHFHFKHYTAGWPCPLTFLPRTWCTLLHVRWATFPPILVFLWRFVLDLSANTCQTRHLTLRPWPLTFWPLNRFTEYSCDGLPLPILGFLGLSVVELSRGTGQTLDRRPDRQRRSIYNAPPLLGQGHNNITIKIRKYLK